MTKDTDLYQMEERELINEILKLRTIISNTNISEPICSQIHNYHFASNELLKVGTGRFSGSAVILGGIYTLTGKLLVRPITITNGLSDNSINALLDDIEKTFNYKIEFKPTKERKKTL